MTMEKGVKILLLQPLNLEDTAAAIHARTRVPKAAEFKTMEQAKSKEEGEDSDEESSDTQFWWLLRFAGPHRGRFLRVMATPTHGEIDHDEGGCGGEERSGEEEEEDEAEE